MPFDPRTKSRKTTTLPAALRDELGLPAPSAHRRPFRPQDRTNRSNSHNTSGKPQLKAIGRPQSAVNGAAKGTQRGPIKSLRNQEKDQQQQLHEQRRSQPRSAYQNKNRSFNQSNRDNAHAYSSRTSETKVQQKRKSEKQPEQALKVIKKPKSSSAANVQDEVEQKTRLNPFTGEMELIKSSKNKVSSTKPTALEKMLARAEAAPSSSSKGKARATTTDIADGKKKSRRHMTQQEKEEEDEIRWLEYSIGKSRSGEDVVRDDLDDFLDDLDRFQVGMYDESDSEDEEDQDEDGSEDSGLEEVSVSEDDGSEEEEESVSEQDDEDEEEDEEEEEEDADLGEGMYDFDSNDEDDFSNWDAAMATTDEEDADDDDDDDDDQEGISSEDDQQDSDDASQDGSEAEEARALLAGTADSAAAPSSSSSSTTAPASTTKYIPPALRAKLAATTATPSTPSIDTVEMDPLTAQKLRRQAQGLLNRLGDGNIDTIVTEYESLYRTHPRAHVTSTLTQLILDTITSRSNLIDTFVILHAALVAALHKVVGVEFAAFFVQRLVDELMRFYRALKQQDEVEKDEEDEGEVKGKECLNLTVLACELYNLHVVACPLIYDLIRTFLGQQSSSTTSANSSSDDTDKHIVSEVDIELLHKTIRSCGFQLRSDDSTSLKSIIALTQSRVSSLTASTRTKFMLERMADLQKTKPSKSSAAVNDASNPNSATGQLLVRMKKYLGGMSKKRTVKTYEALRIGLKDLQDAEKKGKWWLVGAAWTGQSDQADAQGLTKMLPMNARASVIQSSSSNAGASQEDEQQAHLLDLARKQGMNTDARRVVFVTLLTSQDFRQASENLLLLKLNDVQRREVVRVLVHCVGSEEVYNPYYTLIGQEICRNDYSMRITLQYCLWDFLREIGQSGVGGEKFSATFNADDQADKQVDPRRVANLARAYAWWITHECLSLQSLKTVDFTALHQRPAQFLGLLMIHIVLSIQSKSAAKTLHLPTVTAPLKADKLTKCVQSNLIGGSIDLNRGLLFFVNTKLDARKQRELILGGDKGLKDKMRPLLETVREGVDAIRRTVETIVQQQDGVGVVDADGGMMEMDDDDDEDDEF